MEDLLNSVLDEISRECRYAEIRYVKKKYRSAGMKNGSFLGLGYDCVGGVAIRVLNGTFGFAATNRLDRDGLMEAARRALKASRATDSGTVLSEEKAYRDRWDVPEKKKIADVSPEDMYDILKRWDEGMVEKGAAMRILELHDHVEERIYINSEGAHIESRLPRIGAMYFAGVMVDGQFEQGYQQFGRAGGYEALEIFNLDERLPAEMEALVRVARARKGPTGKMDLIVGPEVAGIVAHESCGHPMEGDRILGRESAQAGESFVKSEMVGERIGSEEVTIVDDPTVEGSFGYYRYDEEGVPARRRYLYKNGIINEFLLNRETAGKLGLKSNASARSSAWDLEPIVRMSTTFFEPGDYTLDELVEDVKHGILMKSFTEWNIDDVRYNQKYVGREAYLIENGEIKEPVKRPILEITTPGFHMAVDARGRKMEMFAGTCGKSDPMQGVPVWMGGPYIRLRNVYVG